MKKELFISALLPVFISMIYGQSWDNYTGTYERNSRHLIALDLNLNYININNPPDTDKQTNILVFVSENKEDEIFFQVLCEKLCSSTSIFEYVTDRIYYDKNEYSREKLRHYLKSNKLVSAWPPIFWESKEIELAIARKTYSNKILLLSGIQTKMLIQSDISNKFDSIIILSPLPELLDNNAESFQNKKILWIGDQIEISTLSAMKEKFGGELISIDRSSSGKNILLRNTAVIGEILIFLNRL